MQENMSADVRAIYARRRFHVYTG